MKYHGALAALLMGGNASAFSLVVRPAISGITHHLYAFRQSYQYQLDELTGKVNINGDSFDKEEAAAQIDADLKESQVAGAEAMARFVELEAQVLSKEQQQREMAKQMRDELEKQKAEYQKKVNEMGNEVTYIKLEAHKEKMETIETYKAREKSLQEEMAVLSAKLLEEKEHVWQNQLVTNRILETRVELDAALGTLKKQFEQEKKEWQSKLVAEKEAYARDLKRLQEEQEMRNREMMMYAEANRELESKLVAEQEAHSRNVVKYESIREELGGKLTAEQEARNRDLKLLSAEQEAYDKELAESRKLLSQFQQEVLEMEKENNMLTRSKEQTDALYLKLSQAQEMTNRILQKRIEIDGELTRLQRQYKNDSKFWQERMEREVAIQQKAAAEARAELEMLKKKEAALEAERNDLGSLVGQTFKVMFGMK